MKSDIMSVNLDIVLIKISKANYGTRTFVTSILTSTKAGEYKFGGLTSYYYNQLFGTTIAILSKCQDPSDIHFPTTGRNKPLEHFSRYISGNARGGSTSPETHKF